MGTEALFSAGDCPVCAETGAVLLVKAADTGRLFYFCPTCGVVFRNPPPPWQLDEIIALEAVAPNGVSVPTRAEAQAMGADLIEVPLDDWWPLLEHRASPTVVPDSQAQLIRRLCEGNPRLRELLEEHVRDQGQLLPHVYFGDVTRWFVSRVSTGAKHDETEALEILRVLEDAMSGDAYVQELIVVSFLENLLGSPNLDEIQQLLPPRLREAFRPFYDEAV